ncbi:MAG: hypothetical protein GXP39_00840 [Chloroflexi bacterium]|nr:hypothetical protein [Chloroflexota bacterium]
MLGSLVFAGGVTVWEYTNSSQFCGTTCHAMPPEYKAYQISPHARVPCVDCHLGVESVLTTVPRKVKEIRHVIFALTKNYETPIYVKSLRPARYTCEKCHNPEKFSDDSLRVIRRYDTDEQNSETRIYLVMKTGGGSKREGLGRGIHWHIENEVYYIATDELRQKIPYVRQVDDNGEVTEYFDVSVELPPDFVEQNSEKLHRMDCIDCHNRISHKFRSPERALDWALSRRQIDRTIPYIKRKGVEVLSEPYANHDEATAAIQRLEDWYRTNYPKWYNNPKNQEKLRQAIAELKRIYEETVFPEMDVGWETHPDNVGHTDFPGCFRCHDGKHISDKQTAIRLECNICHSIPQVARPGDPPPKIPVERSDEPKSHQDTQWLARHRFEFNETCANCHDIANPGGADNSSFCSNSACHGIKWKYVGLDAPALRALLEPLRESGTTGVPREIPHLVEPRTNCEICHGLGKVRPYPQSHTGFDQTMCVNCHALKQGPGAPGPSPTPTREARQGIPIIPHTLEGREDCTLCHAVEHSIMPAPADHEGRTPDTCSACHKAEGAETPTPEGQEPAPKPTPTAPKAAGAPLSIPHPVEGREDCLLCHAIDSSLKPAPADHEGRSADTCQMCHKAEEAEEAEEAPTPTPAAPEATRAPLSIPHPVEGREDCLLCHATDSALKPAPADHEGRSADTCQMCHKAEEAEEAPTPTSQEETPGTIGAPLSIPHPVEGREDCLLCHAIDSALKPAPADHEGRSADTCQMCHQPGETSSEGNETPAAMLTVPPDMPCQACHKIGEEE